MNKQEVIELAKKAGYYHAPTVLMAYIDFDLLRYTALVAAAERESVWNILFEYAGREDLSDSDQSLLKHLADLIRNRGKE